MPELPEVETMVRGIRTAVEGRTLLSVEACPCRCRPMRIEPDLSTMQAQVAGQTVTAVLRRAKRVVLRLANGSGFVIEPRMTGLMLLTDPPDVEHLRIVWTLTRPDGKPRNRKSGSSSSRTENRQPMEDVSRLWFWDRRGLGTLRLLPPAELDALLLPGKLGPDALQMDEELWWQLTRQTRTAIKVAMLDQRRVAGIGNLYASEILHRAAISPTGRACRLNRKQVARLCEQTRLVLEEAIRYEGSTLGDGTYRNALNQSGSYQNAHRVYDREGESCGSCTGGVIQRIVQAQRSTFYCPACQR